jgi:hypothetical protein
MSQKSLDDQAAALDIWEIRRKDRAKSGGVVIPPGYFRDDTRSDARRCLSQTCCGGVFAIGEVDEHLARFDVGPVDYLNGTDLEDAA